MKTVPIMVYSIRIHYSDFILHLLNQYFIGPNLNLQDLLEILELQGLEIAYND